MKSNLDRGIEHVDASEDTDGRYLYWEQGTSRWYRVTAAQLAGLGEMLAAGTADAYSHWCAATVAEEMPAGWTPELEVTDEQLETLKQEAGQAGDASQARLCEQALAGDAAARARCAVAIAEARAQS